MDDAPTKKQSYSSLAFLSFAWLQIQNYPGRFLAALGCMLPQIIFKGMAAILFKMIIDTVSQPNSALKPLLIIMAILLLAYLFQFALKLIQIKVVSKLSTKIFNYSLIKLCGKLRQGQTKTKNQAGKASEIIDQVSQTMDTFNYPFPFFLLSSLTALFCILLAFLLNWELAI
nr:hypothetical protein [Gammaproteobacteria bacterium]